MNTSEAIPTTSAIGGPPVWYSTGQVARRLGVSRETIRNGCVEGHVPGWQLADGHEWRIPKWWVDEKLARVRPIRRKRRD